MELLAPLENEAPVAERYRVVNPDLSALGDASVVYEGARFGACVLEEPALLAPEEHTVIPRNRGVIDGDVGAWASAN